MLKKLFANPEKIPSPERQEMVDMTMKCMEELETTDKLDVPRGFKSLFVTNKFDEVKTC